MPIFPLKLYALFCNKEDLFLAYPPEINALVLVCVVLFFELNMLLAKMNDDIHHNNKFSHATQVYELATAW